MAGSHQKVTKDGCSDRAPAVGCLTWQGMGEGEGAKDVSDQITDEDQLLGARQRDQPPPDQVKAWPMHCGACLQSTSWVTGHCPMIWAFLVILEATDKRNSFQAISCDFCICLQHLKELLCPCRCLGSEESPFVGLM